MYIYINTPRRALRWGLSATRKDNTLAAAEYKYKYK